MLNHDKQIKIFLQQLLNHSINEVVISPGSRSTPLVKNIILNKKLFKLHMVLDERSAGYFALGKSKISNKPTILICTSGTATLNYSPSIAEAFYSQIPLIIITADRPMHYRDTGSNQTLNQNNIYGNNINWFYDIPVTNKADFVSNIAYKALYLSNNAPKGPVHINWQFEEPLTDKDSQILISSPDKKVPQEKTFILNSDEIDNLLPMVENKKGIILVGVHSYDNNQILNLSKLINWPIIADPLSNLRSSKNYEDNVIVDSGDIIYRTKNSKLTPDTIIHIGALPVSKFISENLQKVKNHIFFEPSHRISNGFYQMNLHINSPIKSIVEAMKERVYKQTNNQWKNYFKKINSRARSSIEKYLYEIKEINYKASIINNLPNDSIYMAGNSLPIRILDIVLNKSKNVKFLGNRGLSGIDGNISIAAGISSSTSAPVFLDIGDLAFAHDIGGLITAKRNSRNLTIFVNNNNGGQIFNLLPQSKDLKDMYEEWFITPHENINISDLAKSLNCNYFNPCDGKEMIEIVKKKLTKNINIIELNLDKTDYTKYNSYIKKVIDSINFE